MPDASQRGANWELAALFTVPAETIWHSSDGEPPPAGALSEQKAGRSAAERTGAISAPDADSAWFVGRRTRLWVSWLRER